MSGGYGYRTWPCPDCGGILRAEAWGSRPHEHGLAVCAGCEARRHPAQPPLPMALSRGPERACCPAEANGIQCGEVEGHPGQHLAKAPGKLWAWDETGSVVWTEAGILVRGGGR